MAAADTIIYDVQDRVATVTLNRPERLNAITTGMQREMLDALRDAGDTLDVATPADWTFAGTAAGFDSFTATIGAATVTLNLESELQSNLDPLVV